MMSGIDNDSNFTWRVFLKYFWLFDIFLFEAGLFFIFLFLIYNLFQFIFSVYDDNKQIDYEQKEHESSNLKSVSMKTEANINNSNEPKAQAYVQETEKQIPNVDKTSAAEIKRRALQDLFGGNIEN